METLLIDLDLLHCWSTPTGISEDIMTKPWRAALVSGHHEEVRGGIQWALLKFVQHATFTGINAASELCFHCNTVNVPSSTAVWLIKSASTTFIERKVECAVWLVGTHRMRRSRRYANSQCAIFSTADTTKALIVLHYHTFRTGFVTYQ